MPGGDRTGPAGEGPKTGRRMGYCVGNEHPGFVNLYSNWGKGYGRGFRGGFGHGRGFGFGFRRGDKNSYHESILNVSEKTMIENEIRILKDHLSSLEKQLSETGEK